MGLVLARWPRRVARPRPAAAGRVAGRVKRPVSRFGGVVVLSVERDGAEPRGHIAGPVGAAPGHVAHPLGRVLGRQVIDRAQGALRDGRPL